MLFMRCSISSIASYTGELQVLGLISSFLWYFKHLEIRQTASVCCNGLTLIVEIVGKKEIKRNEGVDARVCRAKRALEAAA